MYAIGRKLYRIEIVGRKWLSKPELYIGCSALYEEVVYVVIWNSYYVLAFTVHYFQLRMRLLRGTYCLYFERSFISFVVLSKM